MIEYIYVAKTKDGVVQKGSVEADSESAAAKLLASRNLYPVSVFVKEKASFEILNRVSTKDKSFLVRQLATTINAGLPIAQALDTLKDQITNKKLKEILDQVSRDVQGGMPLSASFSRFPDVFSQIDITLIASGETSGTLDKALLRLATTLESDYRIQRKILGAMVYPGFVLVTIIGVLVVMSVYVMPQMKDLFASFDSQLPLMTRVLLALSEGSVQYSIYLILITVALTVLFRNYIKTDSGRYNWDKFKLKTPIIGNFLKKLYLSRFSRTLAGLVGSGVSLIDSLNIVAKAVGNKVYFNLITEAATKVKGGIPLSTPLKAHDEFPPIVFQMVKVGEQTGELDKMLDKLADYFEEEVDNFVKNITSIMEPAIIVFMAIIIGFILVAIMLPIYDIGKVIK